MVNLQNKPVVIGTPIEIDKAINDIRLMLSNLDWISHPYHIAHRFYRKKNQKAFYYPETFVGMDNGKPQYHRLTPDNDYAGMFFFMVGTESTDFERNQQNYLTYPVSIIFSVNLKLIDEIRGENKLTNGLFTQELIRDVRRVLTTQMVGLDFQYSDLTITRDLKTVYREFVLDEIEQYNRAPIQCFRVNLKVTMEEDCFNPLN